MRLPGSPCTGRSTRRFPRSWVAASGDLDVLEHSPARVSPCVSRAALRVQRDVAVVADKLQQQRRDGVVLAFGDPAETTGGGRRRLTRSLRQAAVLEHAESDPALESLKGGLEVRCVAPGEYTRERSFRCDHARERARTCHTDFLVTRQSLGWYVDEAEERRAVADVRSAAGQKHVDRGGWMRGQIPVGEGEESSHHVVLTFEPVRDERELRVGLEAADTGHGVDAPLNPA